MRKVVKDWEMGKKRLTCNLSSFPIGLPVPFIALALFYNSAACRRRIVVQMMLIHRHANEIPWNAIDYCLVDTELAVFASICKFSIPSLDVHHFESSFELGLNATQASTLFK